MSRSRAIGIVKNPAAAHWQLSGGEPERFFLIGWYVPGVADGVPAEIARLLSLALTRCGRVTFPSSIGAVTPPDVAFRTRTEGVAAFVRSIRNRVPPTISLVSTQSADVAQALFDDGRYPWWMQGQIVLLSDPRLGSPRISHEDLTALLSSTSMVSSALLKKLGFLGALKPGVDGDVAGFYAGDEASAHMLISSLRTEAEQARFVFRVVSEEHIRDLLAGGG